jgi:hypothetical protein
MNSSSEDVKDMLEEDSSLGLEFGENLFIGKEPSSPQDCVTIYDTFGSPPQLTFDGKDSLYEYPSIQIRVRNRKYQTGWALINDIMLSLHGRANETYNETLYTVIYCSSGPALLTWDDNEMVKFICNFNLQRR